MILETAAQAFLEAPLQPASRLGQSVVDPCALPTPLYDPGRPQYPQVTRNFVFRFTESVRQNAYTDFAVESHEHDEPEPGRITERLEQVRLFLHVGGVLYMRYCATPHNITPKKNTSTAEQKNAIFPPRASRQRTEPIKNPDHVRPGRNRNH